MKKVFFIFLLITSSLAYAGHDVITINFKDGQTVQYRAKEYWTYFNLHPGYFKYNQKKETGIADADYYCVADYVSVDVPYYEDYIKDYEELCNTIHNECSNVYALFVKQGVNIGSDRYWWYYIRFKTNAIESINVER